MLHERWREKKATPIGRQNCSMITYLTAATAVAPPAKRCTREALPHRTRTPLPQGLYPGALCCAEEVPARTCGFQLSPTGSVTTFGERSCCPTTGGCRLTPAGLKWRNTPMYFPKSTRGGGAIFFGNLDTCRCVTQKDMDGPLIPQAARIPGARCITMDTAPVPALLRSLDSGATLLSGESLKPR